MLEQRLHNIVKRLKSRCVDDIFLALGELRTKFGPDDAVIMSSHDVMKLVVPYIENPDLCSVSLSIVANACLHTCLRTDVLNNNGLKYLVRVMESTANDGIRNRACRALGNIAMCREGLATVLKSEVVPHIVNLLSTTNDKNCKVTAVRTLRILGTGPQNCRKIVSGNGVFAICELLQSEDVDILHIAVKAVASLTQRCSVGCAMQVQDANGLNALVKLSVHSEKVVKDNALICLENLSGQEVIRPVLGSAGAIPLFITVASSSSEYKDIKSAVLSLCFCCRDGANRCRVTEADGLELLLKILKDENFSEIHENIVLSLLHFRYDERSLDALIDLELIKIVTVHLHNYIERIKRQITSEYPEVQHKCKKSKLTMLDTEKSVGCNVEDVDELSSKESVEQNTADVKDSCSDHKNSNMLLVATNLKDSAVDTDQHDYTFSIHSPSYQEIKASDKYASETGSYCDPLYVNFCSPVSTGGNPSSPDRFSVEFNVHSSSSFSPSSFSSGPCSPAFSSAEETSDTSVCFSPTMGSPASTFPETSDNFCDLEFFPDNEKDAGFSAQCSTGDKNQEETVNLDLTYNDHKTLEQSSYVHEIKTQCSKVSENTTFKEPPSPLENRKRGKPNFSGRKLNLELSSCSKKVCPLLNQERKAFEKNYLVNYIIALLSHLSKVLKLSSKIAEKACIKTLIDYLILLPEPEGKVQRIFIRLLRNFDCFDRLIYFNFFGMLDEKMKLCLDINHCSRCSELYEMQKVLKNHASIVAKSGYGIGVLSHVLLTGNVNAQLNCIYTISSLVEEKVFLEKLLIDADGLSVLLELLASTEDVTFEVAAVSLSRMYGWLSKSSRCTQRISWWPEKKLHPLPDHHLCAYLSYMHDVSFILDSKHVVKASRSILCEKSDFFRALLYGHFSEARESAVNIHNTSHTALSVSFHFLHGCSEDSCHFLQNIEFDILLELLHFCDKYLIFEFRHMIENRLLNTLDMDKAPRVYLCSKMYNFPSLAKDTLHFVLLASGTEKKHLLKCMRGMLDLSGVNVLDDIKHSIKDMLPGCRDQPLFKRRNSNRS